MFSSSIDNFAAANPAKARGNGYPGAGVRDPEIVTVACLERDQAIFPITNLENLV